MKYPDDFINKVICGDCLEVMKHIPDGAVDLVLTDPPYGINLDSSWLTELNVKLGKKANKCDDKIIGDDKPFDPSPLYRFPNRIMFGFPYFIDIDARGWLVWDKQPNLDTERTIGNPVEMASSTTWKGFKIKKWLWAGYYKEKPEQRFKHPTQKPYGLVAWLIEQNTKENDLVLDPFLGSGTTAVACKQLGRRYIGIEISQKYCDIANERLRQEELF